jgi:hypothetical protein
MLKKLLFFLLLTLVVSAKLYAQEPYIFYINDVGEKTNDKALATSYALVQKLPQDSAWFVRQFDMRDTILTSGYYKDEQMTIPFGKFIYYEKKPALKEFRDVKVDTLNHIKVVGYFLDGKKNGVWREFANGRKQFLKTYNKGKLDGLYQSYDVGSGKVIFEGYYVNDKKEGDWCRLDVDSLAIYTEIFEKGSVTKRYNYTESDFKSAVMPFDFYTYLQHRTSNFKTPDHTGTMVVDLKINKEGVVTSAKVAQVVDINFDDLIVKAFMASPKWKPATYKGQKIDSSFRITINILDVIRPVTLY